MADSNITRRTMIKAIGAVGLTFTLDGLAFGEDRRTSAGGRGITAYRRSSRGRKASNAVKKHNANYLYATRQDAEVNTAHPDDPSRVVAVTINRDFHAALFGGGRLKADLRHVRFARP
jgi:hypothetical protein